MKQVTKSADILDKLKASGISEDVNVYEAIALNTLPIRKSHWLYKGAVHDASFLQEMADAVNKESLPLQLNHNTGPLPVGRVFHGELHGDELRVLFSVDPQHADIAEKIDSGTVDQVSVSILGKQLINSVDGFDYFDMNQKGQPDAFYSGRSPKGNQLGENSHGIVKGLANWFEMSLVGRGGAQNARIVPREQGVFADNRLAASGLDPAFLVLNASISPTKDFEMDLTALLSELTDLKASKMGFDAQLAAKDAQISDLTGQVAQLNEQLTASQTQNADAIKPEDHAAVLDALKDVAKKVLVAAGDLDPKLPEAPAEIIALCSQKAQDLVAALAEAGKSRDAISDAEKNQSTYPKRSAFRRSK